MTPSPDALAEARRLLAQHYADSRYAHNAEPLANALQTAAADARKAALESVLSAIKEERECDWDDEPHGIFMDGFGDALDNIEEAIRALAEKETGDVER